MLNSSIVKSSDLLQYTCQYQSTRHWVCAPCNHTSHQTLECYSELSPLYPAAGVDYVSDAVMALVFTAADMSAQCVYITITNDMLLEDEEHFSVHLNASDIDVKFDTMYATIIIIDDDCKCTLMVQSTVLSSVGHCIQCLLMTVSYFFQV